MNCLHISISKTYPVSTYILVNSWRKIFPTQDWAKDSTEHGETLK